jgi:hypothetical protein
MSYIRQQVNMREARIMALFKSYKIIRIRPSTSVFAAGFLCAAVVTGALALRLPANSYANPPGESDASSQQSAPTPRYFGVNYSLPFAFVYREIARLELDHKAAIDTDVAQMAQMGLNAFRIHVWDRQISTQDGELIDNKHLELLDYLISVLATHDIKIILSPIAWWPAGYPEPPPETNGFSDRWSKVEQSSDRVAWPVLQRYMSEFLSHVNRYTGLTYAEDPNIIGIELFNEPNHREPGSRTTTDFVNALAEAARRAGFKRPVYYNLDIEGRDAAYAQRVCEANIEGVSYHWYSLGLVRGRRIEIDALPHVSNFRDPFAEIPDCEDKARMIYEFDAPDSDQAHIYPVMARGFREANFIWATMFSYDPTYLASKNSEYPTHYLNLLYTPRKAVAFMVAANVFRAGKDTDVIEHLHVFPETRSSAWISENTYIHAGSTNVTPPNIEGLETVVGVGSSPVVQYEGNGAYFLNRISANQWELEILPDVAELGDPYRTSNFGKDVTRLLHNEWPMSINLPSLGESFSIRPHGDDSTAAQLATDGKILVRPGKYLLGAGHSHVIATTKQETSPRQPAAVVAVRHRPLAEVVEAQDVIVEADIFSVGLDADVELFVRRRGYSDGEAYPMKRKFGYHYVAKIPGTSPLLRPGPVQYMITVASDISTTTFPSGEAGRPGEWDFGGEQDWSAIVRRSDSPVVLFDAGRDYERFLLPYTWHYGEYTVDLTNADDPSRLAVEIQYDSFAENNRRMAARTEFDSAAFPGRLEAVAGKSINIIGASSCKSEDIEIELSITTNAGHAWGTTVDLAQSAWTNLNVPTSDLLRTALALLPKSHSAIQDDFFEATDPSWPGAFKDVDMTTINGIQLVARHSRPGNGEFAAECWVRLSRVLLD